MKVKGFTIVEVLIVIAIIAILLNLMMLSVKGFQNEARVSHVRADLRTLQIAIEAYSKNHFTYPPVENYQTVLLAEPSRVLDENLLDPFVASGAILYGYTLSLDESYYIIYSIGIKKDGSVTLDNAGNVSAEGSAIYVTNGRG